MSSLDSYWNELARTGITDGIRDAAEEGRLIDTSTARLIAACVHDSTHSALGRFAGTGRLDAWKAAKELLELDAFEEYEAWTLALLEYLKHVYQQSKEPKKELK
ncbi:hypothetical protein ACFOYW_18295 [Gryllotalpicola reticulitermitis]|uniref:Uncharacterized protein n=1 Tax=Gryllotalpicola reticulitermitis TaxID=1184153 RepID=A0ABV8QDA1_9MICO